VVRGAAEGTSGNLCTSDEGTKLHGREADRNKNSKKNTIKQKLQKFFMTKQRMRRPPEKRGKWLI